MYFNQQSTVRLLLQHGPDINAVDDLGDTPLHVAIYRGNLDAAYILIENGANPNIQNVKNKSAL